MIYIYNGKEVYAKIGRNLIARMSNVKRGNQFMHSFSDTGNESDLQNGRSNQVWRKHMNKFERNKEEMTILDHFTLELLKSAIASTNGFNFLYKDRLNFAQDAMAYARMIINELEKDQADCVKSPVSGVESAGFAELKESYEGVLADRNRLALELHSVKSMLSDEVNKNSDLNNSLKNANVVINDLRAMTTNKLGVGNGDGNLFVCGNYESIKECQRKLLDLENKNAKLDRAEARILELTDQINRSRFNELADQKQIGPDINIGTDEEFTK